MGALTLDKPSKFSSDLKDGKTVVNNETRPIKSGARKTDKGKESLKAQENTRLKGEALLKANMRDVDADGESLESAEEDAPAIMLGELLENMKIDGDSEGGDDEDEDWEDEDPKEEEKTSK